ncbi:alpha/beta hydrolase [Actinoplanes sp. NPDC051470]|uniref:alpha/beta fold hydrolase n=1 Tax=Actinoplanes sp. NPDC051470 TaxID=3157224 RepID=UPI003443D98D
MTGLSFSVTGQGTEPLLLLHGLGGTRRQPLGIVDERARRHCRILAPDLRAHGATDLDEQPGLLSFGQFAADVERLVTDQEMANGVTVVGISMGAGIAAELAARARLTIKAMLLIRPAWRWTPEPPNLAPLTAIGRLLRDHPAAQARRLFAGSIEYAAVADTSEAAARALLGQFADPGATRRWQRLVALPGDAPTPPRTPVITHVLGAGRDPVHPLDVAESVAADFGADLTIGPARYDQPAEHNAAAAAAVHRLLRAADTGERRA